MSLDIVIVHFRALEYLSQCLDALKREMSSGGYSGRLIVVDNDASEQARALVKEYGAHYLDPGQNLGYGRAINFGLADSKADVVLFMNPDVIVQPGCLGKTLEALEEFGIAGPHLTLDEEGHVLHPPGTRRTWPELAAEELALIAAPAVKMFRRLCRARAQAEWLSEGVFPTPYLCGAMIACRRKVWQQVGPFHSEFQLYFEENDWLRRAQRAGVKSAKASKAWAVHLHNQCCRHQPKASEWYEGSRQLYEELHFNSLGRRILRWLRRLPKVAPEASRPLERPEVIHHDVPFWLEVAPSPRGFHFCAVFSQQSHCALSPSFWSRLAPSRYFFRLVSADGRELALYHLDKT